MNNTTSDKNVAQANVAQAIEFLKSNEADALYFRGNPKLKSAIESVLEKIEELEKDNKRKDMFVQMSQEVIENSILKQKVENVLQNNRNELFGMTYLSKEQYKPYEAQIERINKIEQELLEGEK